LQANSQVPTQRKLKPADVKAVRSKNRNAPEITQPEAPVLNDDFISFIGRTSDAVSDDVIQLREVRDNPVLVPS
jgi:hypothetical protein